MNTFTRSCLAAAVFLGAPLAALAGARVGSPAPAFSALDSNGKRHALSDFAGRIVVLEWINHGCPYVERHYEGGGIQELQAKLTGQDVVWLAVCSSAPGKQGHAKPAGWNKLIAEKGMRTTAVLLDEDGAIGRLYGAKTTPHMYVIDGAGALVYNGAIDDDPSGRQTAKGASTNHVVAAVEAVRAGKPVAVATTRPYGCSVKY